MSRKQVFRKRLLIFPRFQLSIIAINLGVIFTISLVVWIGTERALSGLQPAAGLSGMEVEFFKNYLAYHASTVRTSLFLTLAAGIVTSFFATLILSHRFAGPLIRMRNYFRGLSEGQPATTELSFRDGDYLSDFPPLINRAVKNLRDMNKSA